MPIGNQKKNYKIFPNFDPANKTQLMRFLRALNDMVHELAGIGVDTVGYGTMIRNRLWPQVTVNNDGVLSKEDYRALIGAYQTSVDTTTTPNTTYTGLAENGVTAGQSLWSIRRTTFTGGIWVTEYADGNREFDNIWNNRASLTYISL